MPIESGSLRRSSPSSEQVEGVELYLVIVPREIRASKSETPSTPSTTVSPSMTKSRANHRLDEANMTTMTMSQARAGGMTKNCLNYESPRNRNLADGGVLLLADPSTIRR